MRVTARRITYAAISLAALLAAAGSPADAQQAAPPVFLDERRLPQAVPDAELKQRRAEEEQRRSAEAEAKRKAEMAAEKQAAEAEARRKDELEARRIAAEAEAKRKAAAEEEQRRQQAAAAAEAEAKRKAAAEEEQRRQQATAAAEAEAKRKAEIAAEKQAAEAEARRKDELEARRIAAEAEAKRKAAAEEEQRRQQAAAAAEAEAKRKAAAEEEQRRQQAAAAAEAEAKRKAAAEEEQRRQQAAAAAAPSALSAGAGSQPCNDDKISAQPAAGGLLDVTLTSPCRAGRAVTLRYGAFTQQHQLDASGKATVRIDAFQGKATPAQLVLADGKRIAVPLDLVDLAGISKVAVVWKSNVDLDLHAYEYTAQHGGTGHVWAKAPSSAEATQAELAKGPRGRGFMSTVDDGRSAGDKLEVYTFFHHSQQTSGLISTALDYATRGEAPSDATCGSGRHASIAFESVLLTPRGGIERELGVIAVAPCGVRLTGTSRYLGDAVPDMSAMP